MVLAVGVVTAVTETNISSSHLQLKDIEVKVGGKKDSSVNPGDVVSKKVKPLDKIEMIFTFDNTFTNTEDIDIENIATTVTIEGIDNDDDLDDDIREFDLRAGRDKDKKVTFDAPLRMDEGNYDVIVEAEADDTNGTDYDLQWAFELEVKKDKHKVIIYKNELLDPEVEAGKSTDLSVGIINIGQEDEDDVVLEVTSRELGIDERETFSMSQDIDDESNSIVRTFVIRPDKDLEPGKYNINMKISYRDGSETDTAVQALTVLPPSKPAPAVENPEDTQVVVVKSPADTGLDNTLVGEVPLPTYTPPSEAAQTTGGFGGNFLYIALIGLAYVIVIVIGVVVAIRMFRKEE